LIILLSGDGKYSLSGEDLEEALERGRMLFKLLKENRMEDFSNELSDLHSFVKERGHSVEIFRNAEVIIPPIKCDPQAIHSIMGFQKSP